MSDDATTDRAVADLRHRLQTRLGQEQARPVAARWSWAPLAAAAALVGMVAGSYWGWQRPDSPTPVPTTVAVGPAPAPAAATREAAGAEAPVASSSADVPAPAARPARRPFARASSELAGRRAPLAASASRGGVEKAEGIAMAAAAADAAGQAAAPATPTVADTAGLASTGASIAMQAKMEAADRRGFFTDKAAAPAALPPPDATRQPAVLPTAPALLPAPVGGRRALNEYLRRQAAEFDPEPGKPRLSGLVHVRVLVGEDGKIEQVKVTRSLRQDYDAEVQRLVCDGPAWTPGVQNGRRAHLPVDLTVPF